MESESLDFSWRQTQTGVWQRRSDEFEEFYATMAVLYEASGRMFFGITGHLSLTVPVPEGSIVNEVDTFVDTAFKHAWIKMRHDHPTLASVSEQDSTSRQWMKTYRVPRSRVEVEAWRDSTLIFVPACQTGVDWANSDPPAPKMPTMFVLRPSANIDGTSKRVIRRDLVFRSPHDIIDGIGTLILLDNFVACASRALKERCFDGPFVDGTEVKNLSPSYRIAAKLPLELTKEQYVRLEKVATQRAAVAADPSTEILSMPFTPGAMVPGRHQRSALTFGTNDTSRLLAACRRISATPTHVFHAAAAIVLRDIQDPPVMKKSVRYISYILRNERAICEEPYNTYQHPAALYHSVSGQSLVVDMNSQADSHVLWSEQRTREFRQIVETMIEFYSTVRNDKEHYLLAPALWAKGTPFLPASPRPLPVPPPRMHPSVSISSMGRTDRLVRPRNGCFIVNNPWVTGEELGNGLGLFLGTFQGELCISAAWNDAWHNATEVEDFLNRCKIVALKGLDLM
jgi:hypothetical protein